MKKYAWISLCLIVLVIGGAGCGNKDQDRDQDQGLKQEKAVVVPEQIVKEYDQAIEEKGESRAYTPTNGEKNISISIPLDWAGNGPIWRQRDSSPNSIRVASFPKELAEEAWNKQQTEDVHQVLMVKKQSDRYLLIVHHPNLKAVLVKMFIPDPEYLSGYIFGECRIMDDQKDDQSFWNACKTALESIQ